MAQFSLESVYKSLIANLQAVITDIKAQGISSTLEYHAWDSRASVTELPDKDLLGLVNWAFAENEGLAVIEGGLLLSTVNDKNLFKEVRMLDVLRKHCVDGDTYKTWPLYDVETGQKYGLLQIADFEILPSGRSEVRSTRHIGMQLLKAANYDG